MSLPRYAEYKDSGVPWLGEVPKHWDVAPFKRLVEFQNGSDHKPIEVEDGYPVYGSGGVFAYASEYMHDGESVLLGRKGTVDRPLYVTGKFWAVDTMYWTHIATDACGKFCYYAALSIPFSYYSTNTALPSMTQGALGAHLMAFPDKEEQVEVAAFLDRETAKIDALIAEQETLLALLAEKRQATISHAVTRGLDPDVPMKDSGIAWLGEVPAHWEVVKCGRFLSVLSGFAFPSVGFDHSGSGTRLLRGANVGVGALRWDDVAYWERTPGDGLDEYELKVGDLVLGMDRPLISAGMRVARVRESDLPCLLLQRVASLRTSAGLLAPFLMHYLSTPMFVAHFSPETTGVSVPHISPDQITSFVIAIPPVTEQTCIVEHLRHELERMDFLHENARRAIDLLTERRSALIAAAVTGKIDVRGLAA